MLPEFLNKLAVLFQVERDSELPVNVTDGTDFQIKGGDTRYIEFSKTGSSRLTVSPSKGTFTVAAGIGRDNFLEETDDIPNAGVEKRTSVNLLVDKVARKLSYSYSVHAPDPKAFTAVVKAIFGPSGGGLQCKGVLVELCEGSLTTQTKEVCIQLCKNKTDVVPLAGSETIISRVVELSPRGKPLTKRATLTLPLECATCEESKIFMRWTPSHSGERANWQDVLPSTNPENEDGITLEVTSQKARIRTKVFGIFSVITTDQIKGVPGNHQPHY
ncbi:PREDICTED: uncharacterized protein LOC107347649 [Acropora digitifera]|uniref:uncharacterized protein LOC107347649 n=1 Tax=Acropora digitifera TaxID=70779 RepID=UPI00077A33EB|nr:PREDICTED: uncharacterized protein LOC107347649 [Acropora digitifera]